MKQEEFYSLELRISYFLRYGVLLAGACLLAGWLTQIQIEGNPFVGFHDYKPLSLMEELPLIWAQGQWGLLISYAGLFVLISLPLVRVLMTAVLFFKQGERLMAGLAACVLIVLIVSFSLGIDL